MAAQADGLVADPAGSLGLQVILVGRPDVEAGDRVLPVVLAGTPPYYRDVLDLDVLQQYGAVPVRLDLDLDDLVVRIGLEGPVRPARPVLLDEDAHVPQQEFLDDEWPEQHGISVDAQRHVAERQHRFRRAPVGIRPADVLGDEHGRKDVEREVPADTEFAAGGFAHGLLDVGPVLAEIRQ